MSVKNPRLRESEEELAYWVENTEGFSIAHLKELIVSVECFERDTDMVINRLRKMQEKTISSDSSSGSFGFNGE